MSDNNQYEKIVATIAIQKEVWILQTDDGMIAMFEDNDMNSYIPVWTSKEQAQKSAEEDWQGYSAGRMGIGEFVEWMQELKDDEILIGLYSDENQAFPADPMELKKQLLAKK